MLQARIEQIKDPEQRAHRLIDECYDKITRLALKHDALKALFTPEYRNHLADEKSVPGTFAGEKIALRERQIEGKKELIGFEGSPCQFCMVDSFDKALPNDARFSGLEDDQKQILRFLDLLSVIKQLTLIKIGASAKAGAVFSRLTFQGESQIEIDAQKTQAFLEPLFRAIEPTQSLAADEFAPMYYGGKYWLTGVPNVTAENFALLACLHDFLYRVLTTPDEDGHKPFGALQFVVDRFAPLSEKVPALIGQALIPRLLALDLALRKVFTDTPDSAQSFLQAAKVIDADTEVVMQEPYLEITEKKESETTYFPERIVRYTQSSFRQWVQQVVDDYKEFENKISTAPFSSDGRHAYTLPVFVSEISTYKYTLAAITQNDRMIRDQQAQMLSHRKVALPKITAASGMVVDGTEMVSAQLLMQEIDPTSADAYTRYQYDIVGGAIPVRPIFPVPGLDQKPLIQPYRPDAPISEFHCEVHSGDLSYITNIEEVAAGLDAAKAAVENILNTFEVAVKLISGQELASSTRDELQAKLNHRSEDQKAMSDEEILQAEKAAQETKIALAKRLMAYFEQLGEVEAEAKETDEMLHRALETYPELLPVNFRNLSDLARITLASRVVPLIAQLIPTYHEALEHIALMMEGDVYKLIAERQANVERLQQEAKEEKDLEHKLRLVNKQIQGFDTEDARLVKKVQDASEQKMVVDTWSQQLVMLKKFQSILTTRETDCLISDENEDYLAEVIPYNNGEYVKNYPAFVVAMGWKDPDPRIQQFNPENLAKAYSGKMGSVSAWTAYLTSFVTDKHLLAAQLRQFIAARIADVEPRVKREKAYATASSVQQHVQRAQTELVEFRAQKQAEREGLAQHKRDITERVAAIAESRTAIEGRQQDLSRSIEHLQAAHAAAAGLENLASDVSQQLTILIESKADIARIQNILPDEAEDEKSAEVAEAENALDSVVARLDEVQKIRQSIQALIQSMRDYSGTLDARVRESAIVKAKRNDTEQRIAVLTAALDEREDALVKQSAFLLSKPYNKVLEQLTEDGELELYWENETQVRLLRKIMPPQGDASIPWQGAAVVLLSLTSANDDVLSELERIREKVPADFLAKVKQHALFTRARSKAEQERERLDKAVARYELIKQPLEESASELYAHYHSQTVLGAILSGIVYAFVMLYYLITRKTLPEDRDNAHFKRVKNHTNSFVVQGDVESAQALGAVIRLAKRELPKECCDKLTTLDGQVTAEKLKLEHPEAARVGDHGEASQLHYEESTTEISRMLLSRFVSSTRKPDASESEHGEAEQKGLGSRDDDQDSVLEVSHSERPVSPVPRNRNRTPSPTRRPSVDGVVDPLVADSGVDSGLLFMGRKKTRDGKLPQEESKGTPPPPPPSLPLA